MWQNWLFYIQWRKRNKNKKNITPFKQMPCLSLHPSPNPSEWKQTNWRPTGFHSIRNPRTTAIKKVLSEEDFCTNQHFFCFSIPAIGFTNTRHIRLRHMINEVTDTGRGCLHISYNTWSSLNMSTHRSRTEGRQLCFWATLALFILCTNQKPISHMRWTLVHTISERIWYLSVHQPLRKG